MAESVQGKLTVAYKLEIWIRNADNTTRKIGIAQSLKASEKRPVKMLRQVVGAGLDETLEGVAQIPQAPDYTLTITKLAVYSDSMIQILNTSKDYFDEVRALDALVYHNKPFDVYKIGYDLITNESKSLTIWSDCMITSYDMGSYEVGGAEVIETCEIQALRCRTEYRDGISTNFSIK